MTSQSDSELKDVDRVLALGYVPKSVRHAVAALWQLDETLGRIVASTSEPMIGQMRLTWWHERLYGLDDGERAAEPVLTKMAAEVLPHDVKGAELAVLIEGWEALLEPLPLTKTALETFAEKRGAALFRMTGRLLDGRVSDAAGEGWALMDFALKCSDAVTAGRAASMAADRLRQITPMAKSLRILSRLARARASRPLQMLTDPLPRFVFLRAVLG